MNVINYHELTIEESKDSPARKKQFVVICVLGFGTIINAFINAGGLHPVTVQVDSFPGGEFWYKMKARDYAASSGTLSCTATDLELNQNTDGADFLYSIFIDDPSIVNSGNSRYFSGALFNDNNVELFAEKRNLLQEKEDGPFCSEGNYEVATIPNVKAVVAHTPFTNGLVSSLLFGLKILPAMIKNGKKHGVKHPVTITTCSAKQQMCTHFVPIEGDETAFLLGRPDTETYQAQLKTKTTTKDTKVQESNVKPDNLMKDIKDSSPL